MMSLYGKNRSALFGQLNMRCLCESQVPNHRLCLALIVDELCVQSFKSAEQTKGVAGAHGLVTSRVGRPIGCDSRIELVQPFQIIPSKCPVKRLNVPRNVINTSAHYA